MLLERKIVHVPADREREADLNEYGHLGWKVRAGFGQAAIEAGTPDYGRNAEEDDAIDAIANILHHLSYHDHPHARGDMADRVLRMARSHWETEIHED